MKLDYFGMWLTGLQLALGFIFILQMITGISPNFHNPEEKVYYWSQRQHSGFSGLRRGNGGTELLTRMTKKWIGDGSVVPDKESSSPPPGPLAKEDQEN